MNNRRSNNKAAIKTRHQKTLVLSSLIAMALCPSMALADTHDGNQNTSGEGATPITAGQNNTWYGHNAGINVDQTTVSGGNPINNDNTLIGNNAGGSISGGGNTMIGSWSGGGYHGQNGVGLGPSSLGNASGNGNIGVGNWAGANSSGNANVSSGDKAGMHMTGDYNVSEGFGSGFGVQGDKNVTIGHTAGANAKGDNNVVIGTNAQTNATGFNDNPPMRPSGDNTPINASNVVSIGNGAASHTDNGVALGHGAQVKDTAHNSVAIGSGSVADQDNTVSVGSSGDERRVTNVADGQADHDAVNVEQLNRAINNFGSINNSHINSSINHLNNRINHLDNKIDDNRKVSSQGIAAAMAMQIDMPEADPNGWAGGVGVGTYDGESAMALGAHYLTPSGKQQFSASVSTGLGSDAKQGGRVSWGFKF